MPSPQDRLRRRGRDSSAVGRAFALFTDRRMVAALWLAVALIGVLAGLQMEGPGAQSGLAQAMALVAVVATLGMAGMYWRRWKGDVAPERRQQEAPKEQPKWAYWAGRLGLVALVGGAALMVGDWLSAHRHLPAAQLVLPLQETVESVEVAQGDRTVDVMLPLRTTLQDVQFGEEPRAWVQFARPAQQGVAPREFGPGDSLDIEGKRFAFSALSQGDTRHRAQIAGGDDRSDVVVAGPGERIRLSEEGPSYRVVDTRRDYMEVFMPASGLGEDLVQLLLMEQGYPTGVMGPAVKLETEEGRTFWLFERGEAMTVPTTGESLVLEGLEEVPSVVMTVSTVRAFWPFALGLLLFIIGWALTFGFAERRVRGVAEGAYEIWSTNRMEAHHYGEDGGSPLWYRFVLLGAVAAGIGLALSFDLSRAGWLGVAGMVALVALPMNVGVSVRRRALSAAAAVPLAAITVALMSGGGWFVGGEGNDIAALWTAQLGSWLAMATALVGAGVIAERSLGRRTGGAVTVTVAIVAAMVSVWTLGVRRAAQVGEGMALPLTSESGAAMWAIPEVVAASELQIPVMVSGSAVGWIAAGVAIMAMVGLIGSSKVELFGWCGAALAAVSGAIYLTGTGASGAAAASLNASDYEAAGRAWLEARDLPGWLAERGEFQYEGALQLDTAALIPEFFAFVMAGFFAVSMLALVLSGRPRGDEDEELESPAVDPFGGRDLFVRAVIFGWMGWVLGLVGTLAHLGTAGVYGPMEWLGMAMVSAALAVLMLGWRREESVVEKIAGALGPAVVLGGIIWLLALGASVGLLPGSSVGF